LEIIAYLKKNKELMKQYLEKLKKKKKKKPKKKKC